MSEDPGYRVTDSRGRISTLSYNYESTDNHREPLGQVQFQIPTPVVSFPLSGTDTTVFMFLDEEFEVQEC